MVGGGSACGVSAGRCWGGVWAGSRVPVLCLKDREGLKGLGVPNRECFGQAVVKGKAQSSSSLSCLMCDLKVWQYGVA